MKLNNCKAQQHFHARSNAPVKKQNKITFFYGLKGLDSEKMGGRVEEGVCCILATAFFFQATGSAINQQGGEKIYFFSSFWMTTDRALSVQQCISKQNTTQFGVITCFIALLSLDTMISQTTGWGCSAKAYYVFSFFVVDCCFCY